MRYKVEKFEQGGWATFTPVLHQQAVTEDSKKSSGGETKESKRTISSLLDDKVFEDLMGKGLTNDVNSFVNEMIKLESNQINPFASSGNRSSALRLVGKINELKQNKTAYDEAIKTAQSNGGYGEIAVGNNGELYAKDNAGKVSQISIDQYNKMDNSSNFRVLTVAELMNERQNNPNLVGQNSLFNVSNNAIGFNKITDHIKGLVAALGTETTEETKTYSRQSIEATLRSMEINKKPTIEEQKSMQELKQILTTPSEYYKINTKNSSERNRINIALNYIWGTLGQPSQQKLRAVAATNGMSDPKEFIIGMLTTQTNISTNNEVTAEKTPGESSNSGGASNEKSLTQFQLMHKDKLANPNMSFAINDPKMGTMFQGIIGGVAPLMLPNGDGIGLTTVQNILTSGYNQFLKGSEVYFGDKRVSNSNLNNLIYDANDAAKVYMPVKNGQPDYKSLAEFKDLYAVYEANKNNWTIGQAEKHFATKGYKIKIDEKYEDGKKIKVIRDNEQVKPFLVMYAYTNDGTDLVDNNEQWLTKLTSDEEKYMKPRLEEVWTVGKDKKAKNLTPDGWGFDRYYKGIVAIPYRNESAAIIDAMVGQGPKDKIRNLATVQNNLNKSSGQTINASATRLN